MVGQVRSLTPVRGSAFLSWFAATYCKNMPLSLGTQIAYHLDEYMGLTPFSGQSTIGLAQDSRLGGPARIDMGNPSRDSGFPAYILIYAIPAAEETGQTLADISLEQAQKAVEAALKKSTDMGVKMDIAVVDAGANLKAFARMDGAWLGSIDIAQKKGTYSPLVRHAHGQHRRPLPAGWTALQHRALKPRTHHVPGGTAPQEWCRRGHRRNRRIRKHCRG